MKRINVDVNLPELHIGQKEVARDKSRFKVLACGRRWGKTRLATLSCIKVGCGGGAAWWIAPSYPMSNVGWKLIKAISSQIPGINKHEDSRQVDFPGGGWVQVKSGDNPDSLRGEGLNLAVLDECAFMSGEVWESSIRAALSDKIGDAIFISTPKGRNWFWKLYQKGGIGEPGWRSWSFPTSANPFILASEVETARAELPENIFRQEYLAEFLENEGSVFRNILACINAPANQHYQNHQNHEMVAGVDWGKQNDFTAISILCAECKREVILDRFNRIDYAFQRKRLANLMKVWHVKHLTVEANSMGEPVIEELRRDVDMAEITIEAFQTTASSKPPLIESLALAFERAEAQWLNIPAATVELEAYERKVSQVTGRPSYSAPEGMHDDTVMARALAYHALTNKTIVQIMENPFYG